MARTGFSIPLSVRSPNGSKRALAWWASAATYSSTIDHLPRLGDRAEPGRPHGRDAEEIAVLVDALPEADPGSRPSARPAKESTVGHLHGDRGSNLSSAAPGSGR